MKKTYFVQVAAIAALAVSAVVAEAAKPNPPAVERHAASPTANILQSATVRPGAQLLFLSGQLANPLNPIAREAGMARDMRPAGPTELKPRAILILPKKGLKKENDTKPVMNLVASAK